MSDMPDKELTLGNQAVRGLEGICRIIHSYVMDGVLFSAGSREILRACAESLYEMVERDEFFRDG